MPQKRNRRQTRIQPPPHQGVGTTTFALRLSALDLHYLAKRTGLKVVADEAETENIARRLRRALRDYVVNTRAYRAATSGTGIASWAEALRLWASEGIEVLGGDAKSTHPQWSCPATLNDTMAHLARGWPVSDGALECGQRRQDLEILLKAANVGKHRSQIATLLEQTLSSLSALRILAAGAEAWAGKRPPRMKTDYPIMLLFKQLRFAYETLHGKRYTSNQRRVSNSGLNHRESLPGGAASAWTRSLLCVVNRRSRRLTSQEQHLPELVELYTWGIKTDALHERIKQASIPSRPTGR